MFLILTLTILWIFVAVIAARIASNKGRSFRSWLIYGFFLSPIALIHSIILEEDTYQTTKLSVTGQSLKKCPSCGEFVRQEASVCRYCGKEFSYSGNTSLSYSVASDSGSNYWYCSKCGCSNRDDENFCKSCNTPRYSMNTLSEEQKTTVKEYAQKQLNSTDIEEIRKLQNSYFGTDSLKFMSFMLPDASGYNNLELYKEKLKEAISESKVQQEEKKEEADTNKIDESNKTDNLEEELEKMKNLFERGLIDESEYKAKKNKILGI